jgi:hypothetical protein
MVSTSEAEHFGQVNRTEVYGTGNSFFLSWRRFLSDLVLGVFDASFRALALKFIDKNVGLLACVA